MALVVVFSMIVKSSQTFVSISRPGWRPRWSVSSVPRPGARSSARMSQARRRAAGTRRCAPPAPAPGYPRNWCGPALELYKL